jgi:large subunit ribosomal protein L10
LVKRAVTDLPGLQEVAPFLCQQRGVVFVHSEPTIIAKVLCDFAKDHEQLSIIAGYVDKECVDAQVVKALAMLPPRDVLRAQLLGAMQAPMAQLIGILRRVQVQLLATLHCINQKKENQ